MSAGWELPQDLTAGEDYEHENKDVQSDVGYV